MHDQMPSRSKKESSTNTMVTWPPEERHELSGQRSEVESSCHDHARPLPRPSHNSDPSLATPKLIAVPQLNSGHYISLRPRTPPHCLPANLRSNPSISDLSPSLDKTLNLVQLLLDPQLSYSSILDATPIPGPGLPRTFFLARSLV